ncbi:hypothetical protein OJ997_24790 [Solirubrobacter phytolaccae]|uniref:Universal stress protein n=1 Tax=Solirubrobacter phytolaccae TaxID=1404360 RepID=A0A9X3NBG1_9ACTN|nr:hypothetical protein [Solirubrobacter phytolaccae]MDA0183550.1 hypothetical protein [Solirubrobacter phytolaccae]
MHRTLIVANRTASTPVLLQEVDRRAAEQPTAFTLLVPDPTPENWSLDDAVATLRAAAAGIHGTRETHVDGLSGASGDAFESIQAAVAGGRYDDVVLSTLPSRTSLWLRRDLPSRVEALGLPVTVITPPVARGIPLWGKGPGSHERDR